MNYISLVDEIIADARKKISNAPFLSADDFYNLKDYLMQRADTLLQDLEDELEMKNQD
jgi:hypothetical protein